MYVEDFDGMYISQTFLEERGGGEVENTGILCV